MLQSTFLKSTSDILCSTILDAISNIYHSDNANYFILENQNTLSQFIERIHHKGSEVQNKLLELVEFLVFQLNFVPCKELISMSIFLKTHSLNHVECSITCMQTLLNILKHNHIFKDVYREVGLLEVFVTCLDRYANLLETRKIAQDKGEEYEMPAGQAKLGGVIIEGLTLLLAGNSSNANVFRECGGANCVQGLVIYPECRQAALGNNQFCFASNIDTVVLLGIIRELILTTGGDDDMTQLLTTLHSTPKTALQLKTDILKALVLCLRESHRTRTVFRKVNGFVYVASVLVSLEARLSKEEKNPEVLNLLYMVVYTISTAMRFEPANAKFFYHEICKTSLCDTLRLLGCFTADKVERIAECDTDVPSLNLQDVFHGFFIGSSINPM